ncbi:hypothetical protein E2562_023078 [Oryza meyeriana var. granulata]|uniref:Uncharacterized protein n=1 Tax=Oryza meyeriana var. granulata TaxID=110450 RepID=A0A6G1ENZ2_9ORYZ|nr:hypothetical protein E2562_023078 [Oryza meyeriana var. granulata]KAF0926361.1 hypothetical protein E2562_023078 [Oryza meyeriana var. granulata]KAF0926362.1 hypothetical protein E2562_023078 [Oryza meyeriana var. granulata]
MIFFFLCYQHKQGLLRLKEKHGVHLQCGCALWSQQHPFLLLLDLLRSKLLGGYFIDAAYCSSSSTGSHTCKLHLKHHLGQRRHHMSGLDSV